MAASQADLKVKLAEANAKTVAGENEFQAQVATARATLQVREAEAAGASGGFPADLNAFKPFPALPGAVAYESTVRNAATGFGAEVRDDGRQYGSPSRLLAVLNMGPLSQYPADPRATVPARALAGDTPLTTIGHEAGHLFLARGAARAREVTTRLALGASQRRIASHLLAESLLVSLGGGVLGLLSEHQLAVPG